MVLMTEVPLHLSHRLVQPPLATFRTFGLPPAPYRGTSLMKNSGRLESYSRTLPRALWWFQGGGLFPMSEVTL